LQKDLQISCQLFFGAKRLRFVKSIFPLFNRGYDENKGNFCNFWNKIKARKNDTSTI